jgi:hypothetical protein
MTKTSCREMIAPTKEIKTKFYLKIDFKNIRSLEDSYIQLTKLINKNNVDSYLHDLKKIMQKEVGKIK